MSGRGSSSGGRLAARRAFLRYLAGGFAIVDTPVQRDAGFEDSAEKAYADWMDWTEDGDPAWTRYYAENSRAKLFRGFTPWANSPAVSGSTAPTGWMACFSVRRWSRGASQAAP